MKLYFSQGGVGVAHHNLRAQTAQLNSRYVILFLLLMQYLTTSMSS